MMRIAQFYKKKQEDNRPNEQQGERGNVMFMIFIMIAIFAALNYVMSQGSRSGGVTISKEQANLAANEILEYGQAIKRAVQTLQINGCSDTEISFENPVVSGYTNPNAPTDKSCHVFDLAGGGLNYLEPEDDWMDGLATSQAASFYKTWFTSSRIHMEGMGVDNSGSACDSGTGDCKELMTGIPFIKKEICMAINKKLNWGTDSDGTPHQDHERSYGSFTHSTFKGVYANAGSAMGYSPSNYSNIMTGCIEGDTGPVAGTYSFFQVLIVR